MCQLEDKGKLAALKRGVFKRGRKPPRPREALSENNDSSKKAPTLFAKEEMERKLMVGGIRL